MTKRVLLVIGIYVISMSALAAAKDMTWDGWISDSKRGAKGANAAHAACAQKCIGVVKSRCSSPTRTRELSASTTPMRSREMWDNTCR